jgi:hypothetical protein
MADLNCAIVLSLYDADTTPRFSYHCSSSSSGWLVQTDGSIHPPSRSRTIQIRAGYPSGARFTGFQLVSEPANFKPRTTDPWWVETGLEGCVKEPDPFPPPSNEALVLTLDFTDAPSGLLFYQLALDGHWDEPKIYDDGSE